jgi:hypothetical protein
LQAHLLSERLSFPGVADLSWRVDVAISSSKLSRVMKPSVLMQLSLTDGSVRTFEVSMEQFHKLRYNVAKVLKDMRDVESHPIMRLAFDIDKQNLDD